MSVILLRIVSDVTAILARCLSKQPSSQEATMGNLEFPDDIVNAIMTCALRFDGYGYASQFPYNRTSSEPGDVCAFYEPVVKTLTLFPDDLMNFTAFFGLQRCLYKFGGESLTNYSREHIAYNFLFLHLYHREVPEGYRDERYCLEWRRQYQYRAEEIAGVIRSSFRRKGRGVKSYYEKAG